MDKLFFAILLSLSLSACASLQIQHARSEVQIVEDLAYQGDQNPRHRLDLVLPKYRATSFPVVVFVHGGYWNSQDKGYFRPFTGLYTNIGIALAKRGIGTAIVDYRIYPEVSIEGELSDVAQSIAWVQKNIANYGGDPSKMVLAGHSAGGHMVALLAAEQTRLIAAGVDLNGIIGLAPISAIWDLEDMEKVKGKAFNESTTYPVFGTEDQVWKDLSPQTYLHQLQIPMHLIYGSNDEAYIMQQNKDILANKTIFDGFGPHVLEVGASEIPNYTHEDMVLKVGQAQDPVTDALADFVFQQVKRSKGEAQ